MTSKKSPWLGALLLLVGFVVLAAALAGLGWKLVLAEFENTLRTQSVRLAKLRGIELTPGQLVFDFSSAHFANSQFKLVGVPGAEGTIRSILVTYPELTPKNLNVTGILMSLSGDPVTLTANLDGWYRRYGTLPLGPITLTTKDISGRLVDTTGTLPNSSFTDIQLTPLPGGYRVQLARVSVGSYTQGPITFVVFPQPDGLKWGLGETLSTAQVRLTVASTKNTTRYTAELPKTLLTTVTDWLEPNLVPKEYRKLKLSGTLTWLVTLGSPNVSGDLTLALYGFVPPHPPELDTYRFGNTTTVTSTFTGTRELLRFELPRVGIKAGDFTLAGNGRVERRGLSLRTQLSLGTELSCVTLAAGMADSHLGADIGNWVRRNGQKGLNGTVSVRVQVDADTSRLQDAKMARNISVGCGLRPMSLEQLLSLELPPLPDAAHVENLVTQLAHGGLTLPTLPPLPTFPTLRPRGE